MYCKACGYELVGIASGRCPECAREFDPAVPATFDKLPRRTRLRRRLKWLSLTLVVLAVLVATFPRGYAECRLTLRPPGGTPVEFVRTELGPPAWLARLYVSYPGRTRRVAPTAPNQSEVFLRATGSRFTVRGSESIGSSTATANGSYGRIALNGVVAVPENAEAVFRTIIPNMFADRGFGVTIGSRDPQQP